MMSGEYHLTAAEKDQKIKVEKMAKRDLKREQKLKEKSKVFDAPEEDKPRKRDKKAQEKEDTQSSKPSITSLQEKFKMKKTQVMR